MTANSNAAQQYNRGRDACQLDSGLVRVATPMN